MSEDQTTPQERRIAELVAQTVVARLLTALQSEDVAAGVLDTWGSQIDRMVGRGLRRLGFYVVVALIGIASVKLGLGAKLVDLLK